MQACLLPVFTQTYVCRYLPPYVPCPPPYSPDRFLVVPSGWTLVSRPPYVRLVCPHVNMYLLVPSYLPSSDPDVLAPLRLIPVFLRFLPTRNAPIVARFLFSFFFLPMYLSPCLPADVPTYPDEGDLGRGPVRRVV